MMPGALPLCFTPIPITQEGADDDEEEEEEEEVQLVKSIPGPAVPVAHHSLSGQKRPMRDLPWSSEPQNQRARYQAAPVSHVTETYPMYGYGMYPGMGMPMMDFAVREIRAVVEGPMIMVRYGTCGGLQAEVGTA